jgi:hypothetical protein
LTIAHTRPVSGVIVGPDGRPVAGAKLRPLAKFKPQFMHQLGTNEPVMATTDAEGRFRIDSIDDGLTYALLVESDHQGRRVVNGVKAGQDGLKWTLGPDLNITGTIKGDLDSLAKENGKPVVEIAQHGRVDSVAENTWRPRLTTTIPVVPVDGGGWFKASGLLAGEVTVKAGDHSVKLDVTKPDNAVTVDLTEALPNPRTRRVVLRLKTPGGAAAPSGSIVLYATDTQADQVARSLDLPVKNGEVSFEMPAPGRVDYQCRSVVGYWFKDGSAEVPPGDWPLLVVIDTVPAGAIVGRVFTSDGKPAVSGVSLGCHTVEKPPSLKNDDFIQVNNVPVDAEGRFFLGPLPIGGTYVAVASQGHNKQVSRPVRLDGSKATQRVEVRLARSVPAGGRVVGPDGSPVAGLPVMLNLKHPEAGTSWSPPTPTGPDGRFRFDDLSETLGEYTAELNLRKDYLPASVTLDRSGRDVEVRLQRGHVVSGRVLDSATGRPIPGVEVYAALKQWQAGVRYAYESEEKTDDRGRFRFSNLPPGPYQLNDRNGLRWESDSARSVTADQPEPVEVRATLPSWSTLKLSP